ncbi:low molecular weight protein-tyrosine-phosphatase [Candidatus Litorirhabdus singularis]|nr:low molecular weight phosphotyrosine protein phosphatase [Candidatus Litorirhabdus singularis]
MSDVPTDSVVGIMFVCLGNICRSPSAEGICRSKVEQRGWQQWVRVDSTGTAAFNIGKHPDPRAIAAAGRAGYDISHQIARQIAPEDYASNHYIVAMDRVNLSSVKAWAPGGYGGDIGLLMHYAKRATHSQIADPYYAGTEAFDKVIVTLESAIDDLLDVIGQRAGV